MEQANTRMQQTRAGRPKSQEKRNAILLAATDLFLQYGFNQTSMQQVAERSEVSKQTVYSHFSNKDALFSAVIKFKCEEYLIKIENLADYDGSLKSALTVIATRFLALFQDQAVVDMFSIIIAEARNTPRAAELFYQAGPQASVSALADIIFAADETSMSQTQAQLLAIDFYTMLKGHWHMRSLMKLSYVLNEAEKEAHIRRVVDKTMCLLEHYYTHAE